MPSGPDLQPDGARLTTDAQCGLLVQVNIPHKTPALNKPRIAV